MAKTRIQCKELRTGVICSDFLVLVRILAIGAMVILELRLGKSGYCQHSCNMTFGCFSLFDLVGAY